MFVGVGEMETRLATLGIFIEFINLLAMLRFIGIRSNVVSFM